MFVSKETVPVVFNDGEQETSIGNVVVSDSLNFKNFQSMMSEKIGISPHQFSIYLSDRTRGGSQVPVTARFNFAAVSGHRDCVFLVVLKRSRRERRRKGGGGITDSGFNRVEPPGNVMLLRRGSNEWVGLSGVEMGQTEYERRLMELNAEKQRYRRNMGFGRAKKVDEAVYTFNVMEKYRVEPNLAAFNGLLSALCKSKNVRKAQQIFDEMKGRFVPDSKTYSILIDGWGKDPNLPKAREVFREMVDTGCKPDIVTYGIMVDVLCKAGRVDEALGIVRQMDHSGCNPTSFIYSVLVHTYGNELRIEDAVDTFLEMEKNGVKPDVAVYNALIGAFCKVNRLKNVHRVLSDMHAKGVKPNSRTFNIILNSLISRGETDEASEVFRKMIKVCEPDADTYTMMIKMFFDRDELEMALKVWKYMKKKKFVPSMHTFSVLINGLCEKGDASQACIFLEEMVEMGIRPSGTTFGRLRQLLLKEGREDVLKFLQEKINVLVKEPLWDG